MRYQPASLFFAILTFAASTGFAESVVSREVNVGLGDVTYVDPEFEKASLKMAFQNLGNGSLYTIPLDSATGRLKDEEAQFVDTIAPIYRTFNGPEWGYSKKGTSLYYTKADANGYFHIFRNRNGISTQIDEGNFNLVANYCSKNPNDASTMVMGANFPPSSLQINPIVLNWGVLSEDKPSDIRYFPMTSVGKGPRFSPDSRRVTTNMLDSRGNLQIAIFDFDLNKTTQATFDGDRKNSGEIVKIPELGDEEVLSSLVLSELGSQAIPNIESILPSKMLTAFDKTHTFVGQVGQALRLYRKIAGRWVPFKEVRPKNGNLLMNAQIFSYKGKTYYSMEQFDLTTLFTNHKIVIQDLEGTVNLVVSSESKLVRIDPEVVVSGNKTFVYYYDIPGFNLYQSEASLPGAP